MSLEKSKLKPEAEIVLSPSSRTGSEKPCQRTLQYSTVQSSTGGDPQSGFVSGIGACHPALATAGHLVMKPVNYWYFVQFQWSHYWMSQLEQQENL